MKVELVKKIKEKKINKVISEVIDPVIQETRETDEER